MIIHSKGFVNIRRWWCLASVTKFDIINLLKSKLLPILFNYSIHWFPKLIYKKISIPKFKITQTASIKNHTSPKSPKPHTPTKKIENQPSKKPTIRKNINTSVIIFSVLTNGHGWWVFWRWHASSCHRWHVGRAVTCLAVTPAVEKGDTDRGDWWAAGGGVRRRSPQTLGGGWKVEGRQTEGRLWCVRCPMVWEWWGTREWQTPVCLQSYWQRFKSTTLGLSARFYLFFGVIFGRWVFLGVWIVFGMICLGWLGCV